MTQQKNSIKIKKFWYGDVAADGGMGKVLNEIACTLREGTVALEGSEAAKTMYKNICGQTLEEDKVKGDKTLIAQLADLTPEVVAAFTGGTATSTVDADSYDTPEDKNQNIELSIAFLTNSNVYVRIPRVSFDGFPAFKDNDLAYHQLNGTVLEPNKAGISDLGYDILTAVGIAATEITSLEVEGSTGAATINSGTHTVTIEVANGTGLTALSPIIGISKGASISPLSGAEQDFTSAVNYTVTAVDGSTQVWAVTITEAA